MKFKFVHAADLHLDSPFVGIGGLDAALAARLRDASLDALDRIVAKAIEVDAAFVVFAGDLYDGPNRGIRAQLRFKSALARLSTQGIQSFVAHGNHDPEGGRWSAIREWPGGVTIFPAGEPQSVPVVRDGRTLANVHGVSFGARHERENLALRFPHPPATTFDVGVLHCSVDGANGHENYSPCALDELRASGLDYWALGHVHRHRVLDQRPWVVYPGNTQGRGMAPAERGAKGALVVEVEDSAVAGVTPFWTDRARFFEVEADIGAAPDVAGVGDLLREAAEAIAQQHEGVDIILRGRLVGRGAAHGELQRERSREELLAGVRDLTGERVHWLGVENDAAPALDIERIRAAADLRSAVLEMSDSWGATALPQALRNDLGHVGDLPDELVDALLREATYDVLGRLTQEER